MLALHLGPLHPIETALTLILAFGPFVLLGFVIWWRKRQDAAEEQARAGNDETARSAES